MERGWKPNIELSPACPRCGSSNTKFCYYNNYSLTQPRYFCKGCRRYWTKGGSLRNVPVGGGCRKSRRGRPPRAAAETAATSRNPTHSNRIHEPVSGGSTSIDLAAVYANFLHQPPPENRPSEFPSLNIATQLSSYMPSESGFFECGPFVGGGGSLFGGAEFSTAAAAGTSVLPPLPGEEAEAEGMMTWTSSEMLLHNQMLPLGQEVRGGVQQNSEGLSGNLSPFSGLNLEAIFRS